MREVETNERGETRRDAENIKAKAFTLSDRGEKACEKRHGNESIVRRRIVYCSSFTHRGIFFRLAEGGEKKGARLSRRKSNGEGIVKIINRKAVSSANNAKEIELA